MMEKAGFEDARELCRTGFKSSKFTVGRVFKARRP
jgi:hypothetical protein